MKDLFEHIYANKGSIGRWSDHAEGYYVFPKLEGELGPHMKFQGKEILNWSINDYLGLANHPEVRKVDAEAAAEYGAAYPMGARMMSGHTTMHEELEKRLAKFVHKEAAYLLNFGYQGMVSIIDALVTKNDVIVYDVDAHACIIDGVRLHFGKRYTYQHNDMESFEKNLERAAKLAGIGAFVAGNAKVVDYLKYNLRSQMFAKSLPMIYVKGALKRLEMMETMPELQQKLWDNVNRLQNGLKERGFNIGNTNTCVTPVFLHGSIPEAMAMVNDLREHYGIFLSIVVYPVIPKGMILLRIIPTASHSKEDIDRTLEAFSAIREKLETGVYRAMNAELTKEMGDM